MTFDNTSGNKEADEKRAKDQRERMEAETEFYSNYVMKTPALRGFVCLSYSLSDLLQKKYEAL
jgi:hypothetical protein